MYHSPFFGLVIYNPKNSNKKKFGYIVSKRISKRAIDRNKIKRLLSESVRLNMEKFGGDVHGLFLAKRKILGKKFDEVNKTLIEVINKVK